MPLFAGSGSVTIVYPIADGAIVKLNSFKVVATIPIGSTLNVLVQDSNTGETLVNSPLVNGDNSFSISRDLSSITIVFTATGPMIGTPTWSAYVDYDAPGGVILSLPGEENEEKDILEEMDVFGTYNGAMVYFPDGCKHLVQVKLKLPHQTGSVPDNHLTLSDGVIGDGEIKFIHIDKLKFRRGDSLRAVVTNRDTSAHQILVYPEVEFGSGGKY